MTYGVDMINNCGNHDRVNMSVYWTHVRTNKSAFSSIETENAYCNKFVSLIFLLDCSM